MSPSSRIRIAAGTRSFAWAERLAESWRQLGLPVHLQKDGSSATADVVRIRMRDDEAEATAVLFLDRRKPDVAGGYSCFQKAGAKLRAGEPVDFDALVDKTYDYLETWSFVGPMRRYTNCWRALENWLESRSQAGQVMLSWHLNEVFPFVDVRRERLERLLRIAENERSATLLKVEARRLILTARWWLFEGLDADYARTLLKEAAKLCTETGDEALALRVEVLRAAALVESGQGRNRRGFGVLDRARQRAEKIGDGPLFFEIVETIVFLESWWSGNSEALAVLEAAAAFAEARGLWTPPRLEHLLRLYRARVRPSEETLRPLVDELLGLLDRGDGTWMDSLDHLLLLKDTIGTDSLVELLTPLVGEPNAEELSAATHYGTREDDERRSRFRAIERAAQHERELANNLLRRWWPGG